MRPAALFIVINRHILVYYFDKVSKVHHLFAFLVSLAASDAHDPSRHIQYEVAQVEGAKLKQLLLAHMNHGYIGDAIVR